MKLNIVERRNVKKNKIKVLLAKIGVDVHDRGIKILARGLRDAGMETIYIGPSQLPENIVKTAIEEDVDVIGISSMEGAHLIRVLEIMDLLRKEDAGNILVICGGIIPKDDYQYLKKAGVSKIFGPGTFLKDIITHIQSARA